MKCRLKHQHVPDLFWSFTEVVGRVMMSVNTNAVSVAAVSAGAWATAGRASAAASNEAYIFIDG